MENKDHLDLFRRTTKGPHRMPTKNVFTDTGEPLGTIEDTDPLDYDTYRPFVEGVYVVDKDTDLNFIYPGNDTDHKTTIFWDRNKKLYKYEFNEYGWVQTIEVDATSNPDLPPIKMADDLVNPKTLAGAKKVPLHLVPPSFIIQTSRAMELGAKKYGPYNWRDKAVPVLTYLAAAQRHILSYQDGEELDPESGAPHLAHAAACMAIVLDAQQVGMLIDDRPKAGRTGQLIQELTKNV